MFVFTFKWEMKCLHLYFGTITPKSNLEDCPRRERRLDKGAAIWKLVCGEREKGNEGGRDWETDRQTAGSPNEHVSTQASNHQNKSKNNTPPTNNREHLL